MNSKEQSVYLGRVNGDITRALTTALRQNFPDTGIVRVETSADLAVTRVFVTGGEEELNKRAGFFRNEIAKNVSVRRVPAVRFLLDSGTGNAARVEELLRKIKEDK